jgi:putative addiction module killer protein
MLILEELETASGRCPFSEWFDELKDERARRAVARRLRAVEEAEHFGDCEALGDGLLELRIRYQQELRIYCCRIGRLVVLLLGGSEKRDQRRSIETGRERIEAFRTGFSDEHREVD